MTPEAQRIAIAEACGWTVINGYLCHVTPDKNNEPVIATIAPLPDYLNDLNDMHEAEKVLLNLDAVQYHWETYSNILANRMGCMDIFHATAAQRAKAFLKTIGKWAID